jgi:TATA-box binding protein (TBP) (component of TFIID and TFIIIB)
VLTVRIDNTFYSQKNYRNVDLIKVYEFMQHHDTFRVDYNVELFAGMYFHPKKVNYPTILFFRTGSYTMMGGKQWKILKDCERFVKTLIEMFDKKKHVMT